MAEFLLAYHGGHKFTSQEEGKAHMELWRAWSAGLGQAVVDPGSPVGPSKTVSAEGVADNGGSNPLSGTTILQADTMDEVVEMVKSCPHISIGGTIEVAPLLGMEM